MLRILISTILALTCISGFASTKEETSLKNQGKRTNLVCFIRFADEDPSVFTKTSSAFATMFNDSTSSDANSMYNYFKQISYKKLFFQSSFYPSFNGEEVLSWQDVNKRAYFQPKSDTNPIGYISDEDKLSREQNLIERVAKGIEARIPANAIIDANGDGIIDNLCIIVSKSYDKNADLLWPHRSTLYIKEAYIHGKRVWDYLMMFSDKIDNGVISHETMHTLSAPDLYHSNKAIPTPVGVWDLMSDNLVVPQGMTAYTKYKYGKWIDNIPEISEPGVYTLNPVNGSNPDKVAYKIKPSIKSNEYFIIEYRKKEGTFEGNLPSSGILIYRINDKFFGNASFNGTTKLDEIYIFRPNGTTDKEGVLRNATFSLETGRTSFNPDSNPYPFFSDGSRAYFSIKNIGSAGETIQFELEKTKDIIESTTDSLSMMGIAGRKGLIDISSNTSWKVLGTLPEWLHLDKTSGNGSDTLVCTTTQDNEEIADRRHSLEIVIADGSSKIKVVITQRGKIVDVPNNLSSTIQKDSVTLTWEAPIMSEIAFAEDFETNMFELDWSIESIKNIGWKQLLQPKKVKDGSHSVTLNYDYEHQDEKLISPTFANGASLSFYSHSSAKGRVNGDIYQVEVSSNNGLTWTPVWDLVKESKIPNVFERVNIDLTPYMSANMKIAFRGADTRGEGISYPWTVDAITIAEANEIIQYEVYRDGVLIGNTDKLSYSDVAGKVGTYSYAIKASNGTTQTPLSNPLIVKVEVSGINEEIQNSLTVYPTIVTDRIWMESEKEITSYSIASISGSILMNATVNDSQVEINVDRLNSGVYILTIDHDGIREVRKIIKK